MTTPLTTQQQALVVRNAALARKLAGKAAARYRGVEFDDLFQTALLHFSLAALSHDPALGKFTTFAGRSAELAMITEAKKRTLIRVPCTLRGEDYAEAATRVTPVPLAVRPDDGSSVDAPDRRVSISSALELSHDADVYLSWLTPRQRKVVTAWMQGETLAQIGGRMRLSKERIRQIVEESVERIRGRLFPHAVSRL